MSNSELIVGLLIEGAVGAIVLVVIAGLLSHFSTDIAGRSLLVIFLFAAAGAYFGFAVAAGAGPVWTLIELAQVVVFGSMTLSGLHGPPILACCGMGATSTLGRRATLPRSGTLVCTDDLRDCMHQF